MSEYTAISFAPVQGFIEKSRKLRDLFGASLILSYLSSKLVKKAECLGFEVISPGCPNVKEGMPNRILVKGDKVLDRDTVQKTLLNEWQKVLEICREWVEQNVPAEKYHWSQTDEQKGRQKGEWERWGSYTWEVFWGTGKKPDEAMQDLERRKLKRDWTAINWIGESSSLSGTDAIAWHQLGKESKQPGRSLDETEQLELKRFYHHLAWILDDPYARNHKARERTKIFIPSDQELEIYFNKKEKNRSGKEGNIGGKFIAPGERLSIPELVKRLVTLPYLAKKIGMTELDEGFKDINREAGYWTGWFMGDGDKVGDKLQEIVKRNENDQPKQEHNLKIFSDLMRRWGNEFQEKQDLFPEGKGRVIYAGGDDFFGVLYSEETKTQETPEKVKPIEAFNWLLTLEKQWEELQKQIKQELELDFTYSVGFVWAGHSVPQRDILQHCREAEKRAKSLGRDRVTIRVVFNSGQCVQWTCPWDYLHILKKYKDRDGKSWGQNPNWSHIYSDWAQLKARHAIELKDTATTVNEDIALSIFKLYFDDMSGFENQRLKIFKNNTDTPEKIAQWIDGLVNVGWQLCSNT
ncbi:type III-B CRISPR-associated protein Cas10/Cmr2 [Microcoleus sp. bin38.metabat.b11b12b14.051]|uniref:Cas10/Cmr2 second palm domain-containing protein n=1 Tax=Microcoleus sp. bin38.metabat.b11b12b14.051 TaxID=2742709 RepID=UPI0025F00BBE|nr:type III-B CRISPR-associated protein Cas10/Cmr2 [Microcoleus sp. bin38.metabat.b11b12b14.051]